MRRWRCGAYSLKGIHRTRLYSWITMQWMKQHEKHDTNMHRAAITFIQINRTKTRDDEDPTECKCFFQDFECFFSLLSVLCAVLHWMNFLKIISTILSKSILSILHLQEMMGDLNWTRTTEIYPKINNKDRNRHPTWNRFRLIWKPSGVD